MSGGGRSAQVRRLPTSGIPPLRRRVTAEPLVVAEVPSGASAPRIVVAGVSQGTVCGVRDHAALLSSALSAVGTHITTEWRSSTPGASPDLDGLARELDRHTRAELTDAVLLHYSVFAFSRRGVPAGVPLFALRLRRLGVPVILFAHEFVYPWGYRGWRGTAQASTQRVALLPLVAACDAVVVATAERVRYLQKRRWLPSRPVAFAPVFSTIDRGAAGGTSPAVPGRVGLFSFSASYLAVELVTGAIADIARCRPDAHLALIGAPGPSGGAADRWRQAAAAAGCPLVFTGVEGEAAVSRQLASCEALVFADPSGPTSRRTSLAAGLAHGKPVVALDGPQAWCDLVAAGAVSVVEPSREALAGELGRLLASPVARAAQGEQAEAFYRAHLSPEHAAETLLTVLAAVTTARGDQAARS